MEAPSGDNKRFFKTVEAGIDVPEAAEQNKLTSAVSRLTASPNVHRKHYAKVRLLRLGEPMGSFHDGDDRLDREAQFVYFHDEQQSGQSSASQDLGDGFKTSSREPVSNVCDPFNLIYDRHELMLAVYSEQSGKYFPVTLRTVRHAITCRDSSNSYPTRDSRPDTYPIQWVRLRYHEAAGQQSHDLSYLSKIGDSSDQSSLFSEDADSPPAGPDAYVQNIRRYGYIPRGTLVQAYNVTGQWFTEQVAEQNLIVRPRSTVFAGSTVRCDIYSGSQNTQQSVLCTALGAGVQQNRWAVAWQEDSSGSYYCAPWQCPDDTSDSSPSHSGSSVS